MAPESPFLDEPEKFKNYRHDLVKRVSTVPQSEPVMLMAHELQKVELNYFHNLKLQISYN